MLGYDLEAQGQGHDSKCHFWCLNASKWLFWAFWAYLDPLTLRATFQEVTRSHTPKVNPQDPIPMHTETVPGLYICILVPIMEKEEKTGGKHYDPKVFLHHDRPLGIHIANTLASFIWCTHSIGDLWLNLMDSNTSRWTKDQYIL